MKPIDAITGLPRSADVARLWRRRAGKAKSNIRAGRIVRPGNEDRQTTVNETPKADSSAFDAEGGSGEGGYYGGMPKDKNSREERNENAAVNIPPREGFLIFALLTLLVVIYYVRSRTLLTLSEGPQVAPTRSAGP